VAIPEATRLKFKHLKLFLSETNLEDIQKNGSNPNVNPESRRNSSPSKDTSLLNPTKLSGSRGNSISGPPGDKSPRNSSGFNGLDEISTPESNEAASKMQNEEVNDTIPGQGRNSKDASLKNKDMRTSISRDPENDSKNYSGVR